jgi:hypothetical protein
MANMKITVTDGDTWNEAEAEIMPGETGHVIMDTRYKTVWSSENVVFIMPRLRALKLAAAIALVALTASCAALPTETRNEEIVYQAVAAADAAQTLRIADEPTRFHEDNPLLGEHPAPTKVAAYFAVSGAVHYAVTSALVAYNAPPWAIRAWEFAGIGAELACVGNNAALGVRPTLSFHINMGASHGTRHANP